MLEATGSIVDEAGGTVAVEFDEDDPDGPTQT